MVFQTRYRDVPIPVRKRTIEFINIFEIFFSSFNESSGKLLRNWYSPDCYYEVIGISQSVFELHVHVWQNISCILLIVSLNMRLYLMIFIENCREYIRVPLPSQTQQPRHVR